LRVTSPICVRGRVLRPSSWSTPGGLPGGLWSPSWSPS